MGVSSWYLCNIDYLYVANVAFMQMLQLYISHFNMVLYHYIVGFFAISV